MTAVVFVITQFVSVPISALQQRFDAGDIGIFITAWTFGPAIGGFAGGIGSALSDALLGPVFAPFTLVIKGCEGFAAGYFAQRTQGKFGRSWIIASAIMVGGYFATNLFGVGLVFGSANSPGLVLGLLELPFDFLQVLAGGLIGRPVSRYLRAAIPSILVPSDSNQEQALPTKN